MQSVVTTLQNTVRIVAVFFIVAVASITVLSLSPVSVPVSEQQVSGITVSKSQLLSNFSSLIVEDLNDIESNYSSQLIKLDDSAFQYRVSLFPGTEGRIQRNFLALQNDNAADLKLNLRALVPGSVSNLLNIHILGENEIYRIHDADLIEQRTVSYLLPAGKRIELEVEYDILRDVSFEVELVFELELQ